MRQPLCSFARYQKGQRKKDLQDDHIAFFSEYTTTTYPLSYLFLISYLYFEKRLRDSFVDKHIVIPNNNIEILLFR